MGAAAAYMGWVEIIRIKANSVRLALNLPIGIELGNIVADHGISGSASWLVKNV